MEIAISTNHQLDHLNTFGVRAQAAYFVEILEENQLKTLFSGSKLPAERLILGGGSNVLFTGDYSGLVVKISIPGMRHEVKGDRILLHAGGGVIWNDLVWYAVNHGFWGIENLALIPGTVGASPVQNIGAYGMELMDVFEQCRAYDTQTGEFSVFQRADCAFSYRDSLFKREARGRYIITEVSLRLSTNGQPQTQYGAIQTELDRRKITKPSIRDMAEVVSAIRVSKLPDPSTIGNAGSFFKNPIISQNEFEILIGRHPDVVHYPMEGGRIKLAAGWLIDQAGWRGKSQGDSGTWKNQALVLVNHGNASGQDIYRFSEEIIQDIRQRYGITLEREVNVI